MTTSTALTRRIYTYEALQQTVEAFKDICSASFTTQQDTYVLQITAPKQQINDEFLNYALGLSAQELLR